MAQPSDPEHHAPPLTLPSAQPRARGQRVGEFFGLRGTDAEDPSAEPDLTGWRRFVLIVPFALAMVTTAALFGPPGAILWVSAVWVVALALVSPVADSLRSRYTWIEEGTTAIAFGLSTPAVFDEAGWWTLVTFVVAILVARLMRPALRRRERAHRAETGGA